MEQFHQGRALECGMWIGESARVDPLKGWSYEEGIGLVKGDVIINDVGVCSVIGRAFPEPSTVPYWMFFVSLMGLGEIDYGDVDNFVDNSQAKQIVYARFKTGGSLSA